MASLAIIICRLIRSPRLWTSRPAALDKKVHDGWKGWEEKDDYRLHRALETFVASRESGRVSGRAEK